MGLWSTITGWFGGGVKVLLWKYTEPLSKSKPVITGAVLVKASKDKTVTALTVKVVEEWTTTEGEGDDKHKDTETTVLGTITFPTGDAGVGYPFDLKAGEQKEQPFTLPCAMTDHLQNKSGVLGGIGKLAAFAGGEKLEYFIIAEASVKGAAFAVTDKQKLKIGD